MRVFISVISHNDTNNIIQLDSLARLNRLNNVVVILRDNTPDDELEAYCQKNNIDYIPNIKQHGFAKNNNLNFAHCLEFYKPDNHDVFLLINPDVEIDTTNFELFTKSINTLEPFIYTNNLYVDKEHKTQDDNVRTFPTFWNFLQTFILNKRVTMVDRRRGLPQNGTSDNYWVSGAFLAVSVEKYIELYGLNEYFFLYCEDIDFSYRAKKLGMKVKMIEKSIGIHYRKRKSKKLLSKYFYLHLKSVLILTLSKIFNLSSKSSLKAINFN